MKRMVIAVIAAASLPAWAYNSPQIEDDSGPVRRCQLEGKAVYQRGGCAPGELLKAWNLNSTPQYTQANSQQLRGSTPREQTALDRIAERNRQTRDASEQSRLPRLDVESSCQDLAAAGTGYSATVYKRCLEMEQESYGVLPGIYGDAPSGIRQSCIGLAKAGTGGSYRVLQRCLEMEMESASANPSFDY